MRIAIPLILGLLLLVSCVSAAFPPPVVDFTANETSVCVFDYVQFTDTSVYYGSPTWQWSITDPSTVVSWGSFDENPVHQFDTAGTYNVWLQVQDVWGIDDELKVGYITVRDCYNANFTANKTCDIGIPRVVSLNGTCSSPLGKTTWRINPNESFSYWDGSSWITDLDGIWSGDDSGDLNATVNFTGFGAYSVTHVCNYGGAIGTYSETKTDYILIGVNGTFCSTGGCSSSLPQHSSLWMVVAFALVMITAMFMWVMKR